MKKLIPTTAFLVLAVLAACTTNPVTTIVQPSQDAKKMQVLGILEVEFSSRAGDVSSAKFIEAGNSGLRAQGVAVPINATNWVFTPGVTVFDDSNGYDKFFRNTISFENKTDTSFQNLAMYALTTPSSVGGTGFTAIKTLAGTLLTGAAASDVARAVMPTHGMTDPSTVDSNKADLMLYTPAEAAMVQAQLVAPNFSIANPTVLEYGFLGRNISTGARAIGTNAAACVGVSNPACSKGTITWAFRFPLDVPNSSNLGKFTLRYVVVNEPGSFGIESLEDQGSSTVAGGSASFDEVRILAGSRQYDADNLNPLYRVRTAIGPDAFLGADELPSGTGSLDAFFAVGGKKDRSGLGTSVVSQSDGKIVVLENTQGGYPTAFNLTRYNKNGSRDASFGTNGTVVTTGSTFGSFGCCPYDVEATSMAIQPDGKIVVVGNASYTGNSSVTQLFALARYTTGGLSDSSFGNSGVTTTVSGNYVSGPVFVALQSNGKIILGINNDEDQQTIKLVRYKSAGSPDGSFNFQTVGGRIGALTVQNDDRIVAVGNKTAGFNDLDFLVARWNGDGTIDSSFGPNGQGYATTPVGANTGTTKSQDEARAVAIQSDGEIVVAGQSKYVSYDPNLIPNSDFALARYNTDGSSDSSFGGGAFTKVISGDSVHHDGARAVAVLGNGKIVAAGYTDSSIPTLNTQQAVAYFDGGTGTLTGTTRTRPNSGFNTGVNAVAVQSDGKLVAVGPGLIARHNP
jgi:uncharacterized delta-60 repeat protein